MTIGIDKTNKGFYGKTIETTRREAEAALDTHRHRLATSGMADGESLIRDFYVFDDTHFAVEQRISICMEKSKDERSFQRKIICPIPKFMRDAAVARRN